MEAPFDDGGHVVFYEIPVPDIAIGLILGREGRNIKHIRRMPGVRMVHLDKRGRDAVLLIEVSASGSQQVVCCVNTKLEAAKRTEDLICRRWLAIQDATCSGSVILPFHLTGFVVQKGRKGLLYLQSSAGILHVELDDVNRGLNGGPQLHVWASSEKALQEASAWILGQMRLGEALLTGSVKPWLPSSPVVVDECTVEGGSSADRFGVS